MKTPNKLERLKAFVETFYLALIPEVNVRPCLTWRVAMFVEVSYSCGLYYKGFTIVNYTSAWSIAYDCTVRS
jgi:hypothetical protein